MNDLVGRESICSFSPRIKLRWVFRVETLILYLTQKSPIICFPTWQISNFYGHVFTKISLTFTKIRFIETFIPCYKHSADFSNDASKLKEILHWEGYMYQPSFPMLLPRGKSHIQDLQSIIKNNQNTVSQESKNAYILYSMWTFIQKVDFSFF